MRKRRIPGWLEGLLLVLASCAIVAAVCLTAWLASELLWVLRCAFGV